MKITVNISKEQKYFLGLIQHEDAAANQSQAVQWCIDSCMKIEKLYGIDACYVGGNNIVLETLKAPSDTLPKFHVKFYDDNEILTVKASNFSTAGILAMAHKIIDKGVGFGIEYIESDRTKNRVPFEI